jgi:hypothetical protein
VSVFAAIQARGRTAARQAAAVSIWRTVCSFRG